VGVLKPMKLIVCDFETEDLAAAYDSNCKIRCVGFYSKSYKAVLTAKEAEDKLWELSETHRVIFHNASFDLSVIWTHYGRELFDALEVHDTRLMAYCLDSTQKNSLETLAQKYLGQSKVEVADFRTVSIKKLAHRCYKDCKLTYELYRNLIHELSDDDEALEHYYSIELPYVKLIVEMQLNGLGLDAKALAHYTRVLERFSQYAERKMFKHHSINSHSEWRGVYEHFSLLSDGTPITTYYSNIKGGKKWWQTELDWWNPNSATQNTQVLRKLYPKVQFEFRKTKDGKETIDSKELKDFAAYFNLPLLRVMATKAKLKKMLEFATTLSLAAVWTSTGLRIYASMNQCVTRTGRLSSSNPNLQNIPARDGYGNRFRKLFVPAHGKALVVGDLDRIELVVLAHYLEEYGFSTYMADAIRAGQDLHQVNADNWGVERTPAKKVIFTLVYGSGDFKLAGTLGCTVERAREVRQAINDSTGLNEFRDFVVRSAKNSGGVLHDLLGRRLYVPELLSSNQEKYAAGVRQINNYLIQGSAGSIFKYLQLEAKDALLHTNLPMPTLCNVVHDEAIYEQELEYAVETAAVLTKAFTNDSLLSVPIRAEFKVGNSWYEAK
jgi:DNA polymerase I-like protein with 3'-5' exonuclease and polymerase domains